MEKTTIQINKKTLDRLKRFKEHQRESYEEVLNNLMDESEEDTLSNEEIREIQEALEEVKKSKTYTIEEVAKELKITL